MRILLGTGKRGAELAAGKYASPSFQFGEDPLGVPFSKLAEQYREFASGYNAAGIGKYRTGAC
jgi:hypothetical protein